jgi:hypothetical protein
LTRSSPHPSSIASNTSVMVISVEPQPAGYNVTGDIAQDAILGM